MNSKNALLLDLVREWIMDEDELEMLDPEDYQAARERNRCASALQAILEGF
jgi:hypothetical protein